jgi:hypothetical protein
MQEPAQARKRPQAFTLRQDAGQKPPIFPGSPIRNSRQKLPPLAPKRLHPVSVFADYRKAVDNDGFAALWRVRGRGRHW